MPYSYLWLYFTVCDEKSKEELAALKALDKEKVAVEEARKLEEHKAMLEAKRLEEEERVGECAYIYVALQS